MDSAKQIGGRYQSTHSGRANRHEGSWPLGVEFTVVSKSEIKATVPEGATTGEVKVTTPRRKLSSNVPFRVTK